ncbi:FUT-1 [Lepeophtheirus salmonis]|uniref:Fucosyltransferase n=1 Tax=Lepeophtheirus salmonis TaxID=72036 RepID=A0A7R8H1G8_LEPSM|nr:FUT-1 [Lepeophtheirus salmonis]CAF2793638.1 FUT-1 [Lepeophtheirus salmonis]
MKPTFIKIIKTLAVIALFGIILICLNLNMFSKRQSNFEEFIVEDKPSKREENVKYIFYYSNIFGGSWELVFGYGRQPFEKCEYSNCYLSMDNTKPIPFYKYSATIIHARDNCGPGAANGIRQNRVYMMAYSIGQWGIILMLIILRKKNKLAFWIASHRWSLGKRDDYVELLKKYITVDKYGLFGPKNCPDSSNPVRIDCKKHFATYYKFYFAFENSLCQDYVTEKYFQALRLPVVPVVYGRVNYTAISPPHSFINVRDFKNPKALAEYLMYLDKNDTAYSEYFKWKLDGHYKISSFPQEVQKTLCNLCHKLNNLEHRPAYTTTQINKYWRGTKKDPVCSTPEDYIPGLKKGQLNKI